MKLSLLSILNEITARQGKRTGGFEFSPNDILNVRIAIFNGANAFFKAWKKTGARKYGDVGSVLVRDPVSGKDVPIRIFTDEKTNHWDDGPGYIWASDEHEIGFNPYELFNRDINMTPEERRAQMDSIIEHELTHVFDRSIKNSTYNYDSNDVGGASYFNDPAEKKAFFQELVHHFQQLKMKGAAPRNLDQALQGSSEWVDVAPHYGNNPKIMRKLAQAYYSIFHA